MVTLLTILGLSFLILGHEAGHFFTAKAFRLKIDEFGFGFPPRMFAKKRGETEYSFNWLPFGGFVKIAGENDVPSNSIDLATVPEEEQKRYFSFQPAWKRVVIIVAGVAINFVIGWLLLSAVFMVGTPRIVVVTGVQEGSPAAGAGFQEGDIVKGFSGISELTGFINEHRGKEMAIEVLRDGEAVRVSAVPRVETPAGEGALGILLSEGGTPRQGFFVALYRGLIEAGAIAWMTLAGLYQIVAQLVTKGSLVAGVVGPVGIFSVAQQTGQLGLVYLLQLLSIISINLAVINLVPFPALDGGRFWMILIEKLKGSPVPRKVEALVNGVGFVLLLLLMAALTVRDVSGLF